MAIRVGDLRVNKHIQGHNLEKTINVKMQNALFVKNVLCIPGVFYVHEYHSQSRKVLWAISCHNWLNSFCLNSELTKKKDFKIYEAASHKTASENGSQ